MTTAAAILLGAGAGILLLPTLSDLVSLLRSVFRPHRPSPASAEHSVPLLFLVLAHNEEASLPACLRSLLALDYDPLQRTVVVVADNCSDRTADIARQARVKVLERRDETHRGKPWAIAWALTQLDLDALHAVVIIDADTDVAPDFARALAARSPLPDKVLQPFIGVQNPDANDLTRLAALYSDAMHGIGYRVKERAGLNVPLGVGMCIGRNVLKAAPWAAFSIAEDWELYAIYTARGVPIEPAPEGRIAALEAQSLAQSGPQRHRWMMGKLVVLRRYALTLLRSRRASWWQRLDAIAELTAPGPAVLLAAGVLGAAVAWGALPSGPDRILAGAFLLPLLRPMTYTLVAMVRRPKPLQSARAFLFLPAYAVWRVWAILRFLPKGTRHWVRTGRASENT